MLGSNGYFIFSVSQSEASPAKNMENHYKTVRMLKEQGLPFKEVQGSYQGIKERSILMLSKYESTVMSIASDYNQDSVLYVNGKGDAQLDFLDNRKTLKLGKMTATTKEKAESQEAYTYDYSTGVYYITV